jgi:hypothetical protein
MIRKVNGTFAKGYVPWNKGTQFCPKGHDTFVVGRNKNNQCNECKKHSWPVKEIQKQFCPKGHDTFVTGRYSGSMCKECLKEYQTTYRLKHAEEYKVYFKQRLQNNPELRKLNRLYKLKSKTKRGKRIVKWGQEGIKEFYKSCPKNKVVDHIIPLLGKLVSGLHVHWNLQYLTKPQNDKKNNKCNLLEASKWYGKILENAGIKAIKEKK